MSPVTTSRKHSRGGAGSGLCTQRCRKHATCPCAAAGGRPPVAASQDVPGALDARVHHGAQETTVTFFLRLESQVQSLKENYVLFQDEEETVHSEPLMVMCA